MVYQDVFTDKVRTTEHGILRLIGSFAAMRAKSGQIVGSVKIRVYKGNVEILFEQMNVPDTRTINKKVNEIVNARYLKYAKARGLKDRENDD